VDLRPLPLRDRKARFAKIAQRAEGWIAFTNAGIGEGRTLYRAVVDADLEGFVAKKLADPYKARPLAQDPESRRLAGVPGGPNGSANVKGATPVAGNRPGKVRSAVYYRSRLWREI